MFWYLMDAMLDIVWIRILGLFGLMFDFFGTILGSLGQRLFLEIWRSGIPCWGLWGSVFEAWRRPNG